MKCSLLCIGSLYVALLSLNKPLQAKPYFARFNTDYFTYHIIPYSWFGADYHCKDIGSGELLGIAQTRRKEVVDFIKDLWNKHPQEQWIWTNAECGRTECDQNVNWAPGYPLAPPRDKLRLIFDAQSGTYKNIEAVSTAGVTQFACMFTEENLFNGRGIHRLNNSFCFQQDSPARDFDCFCYVNGADVSEEACTSKIAGACCDVASSSTSSSRAPAIATTQRVMRPNCAPNPCQNGGTCSANAGSVTCNCVSAFQGLFCQSPVDIDDTATDEASAVTSALGGYSTIGVIIGVSIAISLIAFVTFVVYNRKKKAQQQRATGNAAARVASMSQGSFSISASNMSVAD